VIVYSPAEMSQITCRILGRQQIWQSSIYSCFEPAEESMLVSFHSPHPAHWNPAFMANIVQQKSGQPPGLTAVWLRAYHLYPLEEPIRVLSAGSGRCAIRGLHLHVFKRARCRCEKPPVRLEDPQHDR